MIEANPRASRTVPFVSKAIGVPLAKVACRLILGERLADSSSTCPRAPRPRERQGGGAAVQAPPRRRRAARPRDEVDGRGDGHRGRLPDRLRQGAGRRGRRAARARAPCSSRVCDTDKPAATQLAARMHDLGFRVLATRRHGAGDPARWASRSSSSTRSARARRTSSTGSSRGDVDMVINTPAGRGRAHRRLGDPPRGGRARHPLHHDDDGRLRGRSARSARPQRRDRRALAAGAARRLAQPLRAGGRSR